MSRPPVVLAVLLVLACKRAEAPTSITAPSPPPATPTSAAAAPAPAPAAPAANSSEKAWKVKPTGLSAIKADPPSYLDKPTLVFVAVKPTDYFNYGYNGARNSHFAFEMRPLEENGRLGAAKLYGYAARSWARPFFDEVNKKVEASGKEYAAATLVVAYSKKRYDGRSADHIEILAGDVGEKLDMDPASVTQAAADSRAGSKNTRAPSDCNTFRKLAALGVGKKLPQYCHTYPVGVADRLFDGLKEDGAGNTLAMCVASGVEQFFTYEQFKNDSSQKLAAVLGECQRRMESSQEH